MNCLERLLFCVIWLLCICIGPCRAAGPPKSEAPRLVVQTGHTGAISLVAISPKGRTIASVGSDNAIKLWDLDSGRELRTLGEHWNVISLAFSHDGSMVVSGMDKNIMVWEVASGRELRTLTGHSGKIRSVDISPDGKTLVSGGLDGSVTLWDLASAREILTLGRHDNSAVLSVAFSPDGKNVLSGGADKNVTLWDVVNGWRLRTFEGHSGSVNAVAFSTDGGTIVSSSDDKTLRVWDAASGSELRTIKQSNWIYSLAVSRETNLAAVHVRNDDTIRLFDFSTGKELPSLGKFPAGLSSFAFSQGGKTLVSGDDAGAIKLWDVGSGRELQSIGRHASGIQTVAFSPDGRTLASGTGAVKVKLWDMTGGGEPRTLDGHSGTVASLAISPDGKMMASANHDADIKLWDMASGRELGILEGHSARVEAIAFSSDGGTVVSGSMDTTVKVWVVSGERELRTLRSNSDNDDVLSLSSNRVSSVAISPDGSTVLSGNRQGEIVVWNVHGGRKLRTIDGHLVTVNSIVFSPDGKTFVSGSADKTVKVWDLAGAKELRTLKGHTNWVTSVAISPDGRTIASGSWDKTVRLWDGGSGRLLQTLGGDLGSVNSVAFSPDGKILAIGSGDGTVRLNRVADGALLATLTAFNDGHWVVTDPEGRFDTENLEDMPYLHWVMPDDPLTPIPLEAFMKEYYEPGLLLRILNGDKFRPVKDLMTLNRAIPNVSISSISREDNGDTVTVAVKVSGQKRKIADRDRESGAADLKLFRAGQLVGFREGMIELESDGARTVVFNGIRLPRSAANPEVEFSAYCFNDDGVKSLTSRSSHAIPADLTPEKGKAYLVTIGVDRHQNAAWDLKYAASDARYIRQSLEARIPVASSYRELIPITLTDELATKENIKAVCDLLSGKEVSSERKERIPGGGKLAKATPEDLLIITFSGHGHVDDNGVFYTFTHDTGPGESKTVTPDLLGHIISSDELSRWLRYVDAGEIAMIVDACHSAATVGDGFKPGPMGSRGLGQLAYDKGMKILAASQADDVALESDKLRHGLLTYALVHDGLEAFQADYMPVDKTITLGELLAYGVGRVPKLYEEVKTGNLSAFGRGEASRAAVVRLGDGKSNSLARRNPYQTPALFDFNRRQRGDATVAVQ